MILFLCTVYGMTCQGKSSKTGSGLNWLRECWKKGEQKYDMDFMAWILYTQHINNYVVEWEIHVLSVASFLCRAVSENPVLRPIYI